MENVKEMVEKVMMGLKSLVLHENKSVITVA